MCSAKDTASQRQDQDVWWVRRNCEPHGDIKPCSSALTWENLGSGHMTNNGQGMALPIPFCVSLAKLLLAFLEHVLSSAYWEQ